MTIAIAGDTIQIAKGQFVETPGVVIDKNLVLHGVGSWSTNIKGSWQASVVSIKAGANVQINGVQIQNGTGVRGGGIKNEGIVSLNNVRIWKNNASYGGGISNSPDAALYMTDSEIAYNSAENFGAGLYNEGYASLTRMRIVANHSVVGGGIGCLREEPGDQETLGLARPRRQRPRTGLMFPTLLRPDFSNHFPTMR